MKIQTHEVEEVEHEDFPPAARRFLDALYEAKSADTDAKRIAALRESYDLENTAITADGLGVLEFYALTKAKII